MEKCSVGNFFSFLENISIGKNFIGKKILWTNLRLEKNSIGKNFLKFQILGHKYIGKNFCWKKIPKKIISLEKITLENFLWKNPFGYFYSVPSLPVLILINSPFELHFDQVKSKLLYMGMSSMIKGKVFKFLYLNVHSSNDWA